MAKQKIKLLVSTKVGTGKGKKFVTAGEVIEVDEKTAKIMIDDGRAIDPSSQKVVEVVKDEKLISENETLTKKVEELESEKVISDKKIEDLESELVESKSKEVDPLAGKK